MNNAQGDRRTPATVERLAAHKKLDPAWLRARFRLDNDAGGAVIPYPQRRRLRTHVETSQPTIWLDDGMCSTYVDAATLSAARDRGELVIGEGETDRWTLEAHSIPALGVPGSTMTKYITAENIAGIRRLFIVREPGNAGQLFVKNVAQRLNELRFRGEAFIVDVQATCGAKDPSALHLQNPEAFEARWRCAIESAAPVLVAWPGIYPRPVLHPLALHGPAGDFVRLVAPQSEAAEAALLLQFLSVAGVAMGANAYYMTESTRQYPRLNPLLLGPTAHGRKGTAADHVKRVFTIADEEFVNNHFASGLISGEGMYRRCAPKGEQTPPSDRRVVFFEPEFAKVLEDSGREGNSLSANIREVYDSGMLEVLRNKDPLKVRGVHAAIIGHCTIAEYSTKLEKVSMANGFANRFMLAYVERANILPFGGAKLADSDFREIGKSVNKAILDGSAEGAVSFTADAHDLYDRFYHLCDREGELYPPLIGAMLARLETNVVRVALIYALLDSKREMGGQHLRAAIAVGAYARSSTLHAFGPTLGNKTAREILDAVRDRDDKRMTRTDISRGLFRSNRSADEVREDLDFLTGRGLLVATTTGRTGGRPAESFRAIGPGDKRSELDAGDSLITLIT